MSHVTYTICWSKIDQEKKNIGVFWAFLFHRNRYLFSTEKVSFHPLARVNARRPIVRNTGESISSPSYKIIMKESIKSHDHDKGERKGFKLLTRMSNPPNLRRSQDAKAMIDEESPTSNWQNSMSSPWALRDSMAASPLVTSLAVRTTVTPSSASLLTSANPIPLFAPVTTATVSFDHHLHNNWN